MQIQDGSTRRGLSYAAALRAIGEDLAASFLQSLEIRMDEGVYIARGARMEPKSEGKSAKFERRYTVEDVARLDRLGRDQQTGAATTPDPGTLAEALRVVGGVVDGEGGRFVRLLKEERKIVFEYRDASGALKRDERHGLGIYQAQQQAVAARTGRDIWTNSKG